MPYVWSTPSGTVDRHSFGSVAAPQPNIFIWLLALTVRQLVVAIAVTCAPTSAEMLASHVLGGGSVTSVASSFGRPRTNHSATMSNCSCVSGVTPSFGMPAAAWNSASFAGPSSP